MRRLVVWPRCQAFLASPLLLAIVSCSGSNTRDRSPDVDPGAFSANRASAAAGSWTLAVP